MTARRKMTSKPMLSYELNEEMLALIAKEFDIHEMAKRFSEALSGQKAKEAERLGKELFTTYGVDWMKRSLQLGEEYPDRTYEVIREAMDSTGDYPRFPLLPQRFIEIAYLAVHDLEYLPVIENNPKRFAYRIDDCKVYQALGEACGKPVAETMPCRHACLSACRTAFNDLELPEVRIQMEASTAEDGYCQFAVTKI
jgi:hypothetical protein